MKQTIHAEVTIDECHGDFERMLKRFAKKVKKSGVMDKIFEKQFFKSKSQKNHEIRRRPRRKRDDDK